MSIFDMNKIDISSQVACISCRRFSWRTRLMWPVFIFAFHVDFAGFWPFVDHAARFRLYLNGYCSTFAVCYLNSFSLYCLNVYVYLHSIHLSTQKNINPPTRFANIAPFQSTVLCAPRAITTASIGVLNCHLTRYNAYWPTISIIALQSHAVHQ